MLTKYLYVFFISMVPLVELRGAIPIGTVGLGLPMIPTYITAVVGNMIPVPILYLFARRVLEWGQDKPLIGKPCTFFMTKGKRGGEKLQATAGRGCCSWAFRCPAPAHGPVRWQPRCWIWTSRAACWPAWAACCWRA